MSEESGNHPSTRLMSPLFVLWGLTPAILTILFLIVMVSSAQGGFVGGMFVLVCVSVVSQLAWSDRLVKEGGQSGMAKGLQVVGLTLGGLLFNVMVLFSGCVFVVGASLTFA